MAGRGPAPKAPEQRRNRHKPERGEWVTLQEVDPDNLALPEIPEPREVSQEDPAGEWHPRTLAAWNDWRHDPASTQYGKADVRLAITLAWAYDQWVRGGGAKLLADIRQLEDRLGLNPKGKRDLRWRSPNETATAETLDPPTKLADVRRLKAV